MVSIQHHITGQIPDILKWTTTLNWKSLLFAFLITFTAFFSLWNNKNYINISKHTFNAHLWHKAHLIFHPSATRATWKLFSPLFSLLHSLCALIAVSLRWCVPSWSRPALRSPLWPCPLALFNWQVKPLIWIESVIEKFSHSRVEIKVKVSDAHAHAHKVLCPYPLI